MWFTVHSYGLKSGADTRGGSRGSGPPLSKLSIHLNTSFSDLVAGHVYIPKWSM